MDPCEMQIGQNTEPGLNEERSEFAMRCMLASPLGYTRDPRYISTDARNILQNKELIAIDQDPLVSMAVTVASTDAGLCTVWTKTLVNGYKAVALWNLDSTPQTIIADFGDCGLPYDVTNIRDVTAKLDFGYKVSSLTSVVASHAVSVYLIQP
jgi:alpha-galactosidase